MKKINPMLVVFLLLVMAGCGGGSKQSTDDFIIVDVTKSYPKKELILQDFMDVEYIPLETNDEFVTQSIVLYIGKEYILVRNASSNDGDIFIFDRNGKGVRKINRRGNGPEEYLWNYEVFLDENNNEIFVCDNSLSKILVYDLYGKFKREIRLKEGARYSDLYNYDGEHFIWWNSASVWDTEAESMPSFFITSKQDGSIFKEIEIPFEQRKSTVLISHNAETNMTYSWGPSYSSILPFQNQWIFVESSSDTIYRYLSDHSMLPFFVRTPSIQSMNPEVFLFPGILTDQYYFMQISKKEYDFATRRGAPSVGIMYDRHEKNIFEYTVYNDDYSNERSVGMSLKPINDEIAFYQRIEAYQLVESYKKGELKGRLKEIAAGLDEVDNAIVMLVKYKK